MYKKLIISISHAVLISSLLLIVGCAGNGGKVQEGEVTAYDLYNKNRPDTSLADTGISSGNVITSAIAGIYEKTVNLENQYKKRIENNKVALILDRIRLEQGEAAYKKEYSELGVKDKEIYDVFLKNNINTLEVAVGYATEAKKMASGVKNFDYKKYIVNPMAKYKTITALSKATEQIQYTEKALEFMVETRTISEAMLDFEKR